MWFFKTWFAKFLFKPSLSIFEATAIFYIATLGLGWYSLLLIPLIIVGSIIKSLVEDAEDQED